MLELIGTAVGAWKWAAIDPVRGLRIDDAIPERHGWGSPRPEWPEICQCLASS